MHTERTYLGTQLALILHRRKWTQTRLATLSGISQPSISQIISKLQRIDIASLNRLCNCWDDAHLNIETLIAHLRDEIKRAGHDPINAVDMQPRNGKRSVTVPESHLEELRLYLADPGVPELLRDLVSLLRRARASEQAELDRLAAEPPADYDGQAEPPKI